MLLFQEQYGWRITDFYFDEKNRSFSYTLSTGPNNELYLNNHFIIEKIPYPEYYVNPEIMKRYPSENEAYLRPNEASRMTLYLNDENWGIGTYRAILNIREKNQQYHWVVLYKVDALFNVSIIGDRMIVGYRN